MEFETLKLKLVRHETIETTTLEPEVVKLENLELEVFELVILETIIPPSSCLVSTPLSISPQESISSSDKVVTCLPPRILHIEVVSQECLYPINPLVTYIRDPLLVELPITSPWCDNTWYQSLLASPLSYLIPPLEIDTYFTSRKSPLL